MPCNSMQGARPPSGMTLDQRKEFNAMKSELDKVTRLLCEVLSRDEMPEMTEDMREWMDEHAAYDKERRINDIMESIEGSGHKALPLRFVAEQIEKDNGSVFRGVPLTEMTRDELMAVAINIGWEKTERREQLINSGGAK